MAGRGQKGVDRVPMSPEQPMALHQAVALQVSDHGLDGSSAAVSFSFGSSNILIRLGDLYFGFLYPTDTAVSSVNKNFLGTDAC